MLPVTLLTETPNDTQLRAIAAHMIVIESPPFESVIVQQIGWIGEENIVGTFNALGVDYAFTLVQSGTEFDLSYNPVQIPINFSGGEINDYIEFIKGGLPKTGADVYGDRLAQAIQPSINKMVMEVGALLDNADSIDLAKERIAGLYHKLKTDAIATEFALHQQAATLAGAYQAQEETEK